ncbi:hypothetical protein AK812_SmicGene3355 [Symbiodinium microadriaticum]|uniref:Uncharacterized protein n=1 Tax=Symbiodinium microadriaticum TaxID=2951 RepID=A0A1Q9EZH5_SYMMI|nr:hypothetical protein AK812_SmicGene3355 [Symbiodinium microadriaticum]
MSPIRKAGIVGLDWQVLDDFFRQDVAAVVVGGTAMLEKTVLFYNKLRVRDIMSDPRLAAPIPDIVNANVITNAEAAISMLLVNDVPWRWVRIWKKGIFRCAPHGRVAQKSQK